MKYDLSKIEFKNEKRFLSNMYPAKIYLGEAGTVWNIPNIGELISLGITYDSSEHLYQSLKSKSDNWHRYLKNMSPEQTKTAAKKYLKTLLASNETTFLIRERWNEDLKLSAMEFVINLKFNQNKDLADLLIKIEGDIEERNCWGDKYWGTVDGVGLNFLGKVLARKRDNLVKDSFFLPERKIVI